MKKLRFLILLTFAAILLAGAESCSKDEETTPKNPSWNVEPGKELPEQNNEPGNNVQPPQGAVSVAEAVQYVNSVTTASTDATDIVLKGTCSESEIKELAQSISKGKTSINLDLSNCEPEAINFQGCANLKEVTIPSGAKLTEGAFAECPDLEVVYLGSDNSQSKSLSKYSWGEFLDDVTEILYDIWDFLNPTLKYLKNDIPDRAFENSRMLRKVISRDKNCKVIGQYAFHNCKHLKELTMDGVVVIEEHAFDGCESLESVLIPASVNRFASNAFANCKKLTKGKVKFANTREWYHSLSRAAWIEYKIYDKSTVDETIDVSGNANLSNKDFSSMSPDAPTYYFHTKSFLNPTAETVQCICDGVYNFVFDRKYSDAELAALTAELKQRSNVKVKLYANWIDVPKAFNGLATLYSVDLPKAQVIRAYAFHNCSNLEHVDAPQAFAVGAGSFYGCSAQISLSVGTEKTNGSWYETDNDASWNSLSNGRELNGKPVFANNSKYLYWKKSNAISCTYAQLPDQIKSLDANGEYKFEVTGSYVDNNDFSNALSRRNNDNLKLYFDFSRVQGMSVVRPDCFLYGKNIVYEVKLPESVVEIGQGAFHGCKNIKNFNLPSKIEKIGKTAFMACEWTQSLTLPASLAEIGQAAFGNAFSGMAKPVFATMNETGAEFGSLVWYSKNASTGEVKIYTSWINTEWWNDVNLSFYATKEENPYNPDVNAEYVDLGLPSGTLWATCNVGAKNPWDYGDYFAWGETKPKDDYTWDTYTAGEAPSPLDAAHDAATANWGINWRMPTKDEYQELLDNCEWEWTNDYNSTGVHGYIVWDTYFHKTHIFLPSGGYRNGTSLYDGGSGGYYWSSSLVADGPRCGRSLYFRSCCVNPDYWNGRGYGFSVRPVRCR